MSTPNRQLFDKGFQANLAWGQIAETAIAKWIMRRGSIIHPAYDIEYETGKGPRLFGITGSWVAPDLLVFNHGSLYWVEAKHKKVFTWYRKLRQWETGIDLHHYYQYLEVRDRLGFEVWLLFLHQVEYPDARDLRHGCPERCPVGLFGGSLDILKETSSHTSDRHGRHGMIYWAYPALKRFADLSELQVADD